jgi:glutamate-1-semialdehyde aminotransferase
VSDERSGIATECSGTEAVMMAVRSARSFTGRRKIAKLEGG